jgi:hypothetical protein
LDPGLVASLALSIVTFVKIRYTLPVVLLCFNISAVWSTPSSVTIDSHSGVCVDLGTKNSRFEILPSSYVRAYVRESDHFVTLDDPGPHGITSVVVNGKEGSAAAVTKLVIPDQIRLCCVYPDPQNSWCSIRHAFATCGDANNSASLS